MKTRVVVVDSHVSIRQMLAMVLAREGAYEVVGEAGTGYEALRVCRRVKPRLVILDLALPELNGVEVLQTLRSEMPETRLMVFSGGKDRKQIVGALREGAHAFVDKSDDLAVFCEALAVVTKGGGYFTSFAMKLREEDRLTPAGREQLTPRERAVLQMIAEGMGNKLMADRLSISPKTVEHHRAHLMEKLDRHDVASLTRYAIQIGLVSVEG